MDREWAKQRQWPDSMYLPSDHSKGVYLLEAYHQLHCLVSLDTTLRYHLECANQGLADLTQDILGSRGASIIHLSSVEPYGALLRHTTPGEELTVWSPIGKPANTLYAVCDVQCRQHSTLHVWG